MDVSALRAGLGLGTNKLKGVEEKNQDHDDTTQRERRACVLFRKKGDDACLAERRRDHEKYDDGTRPGTEPYMRCGDKVK